MDKTTLYNLEDQGVSFVVALHDGFCDLSADEIIKWSRDPVKFQARRAGVSKKRYQDYLAFRDQPYEEKYRCTANTKNGTRCLNQITWREHTVQNFDTVERLCVVHGGKKNK